jgi:hypothetical protein
MLNILQYFYLLCLPSIHSFIPQGNLQTQFTHFWKGMSKMEGPMAYRPSGGPINGTNQKLVRFPQISNDNQPLKRETQITTSRKYHRNFFQVFPFFKSKRQERPILIKDADLPQKKAPQPPLKPIIQRHSAANMESSVEASPYMWPHDGSFDPKTTALVIIDMQKDCTSKRPAPCEN